MSINHILLVASSGDGNQGSQKTITAKINASVTSLTSALLIFIFIFFFLSSQVCSVALALSQPLGLACLAHLH